MILETSLRRITFALGAAALLTLNTGCKKTSKDNFVHVDVYGQAGARYYPILETRFRHFSRERAKMPSGRKIMVSSVMEELFESRLADSAYRSQAQVIVLSSEQEAAVDPNLAAEFTHARQGCNEKIPCYLLIPSSVAGEQREAAEQLVDYIATQANPPVAGQGASPSGDASSTTSTTTHPEAVAQPDSAQPVSAPAQ
jgi:hypothetical protein